MVTGSLPSRNMNRVSWLRFSIALGVLAGVIYGAYHSGFISHFNQEELRMYITRAGALAPLLYMATYAVATVLFVPGAAITLLGGALFGLWWGTLYTVVGATIGAVVAFFIARFFGRDFFGSLIAHERFQRVRTYDTALAANGFITMLVLRLVPLFPFNALNYSLGLTSVRSRAYIIGTFLGIIPGTFAYTYFGDSLFSLDIASIAIALVLVIFVTLLGRFVLKHYGHPQK